MPNLDGKSRVGGRKQRTEFESFYFVAFPLKTFTSLNALSCFVKVNLLVLFYTPGSCCCFRATLVMNGFVMISRNFKLDFIVVSFGSKLSKWFFLSFFPVTEKKTVHVCKNILFQTLNITN